MSFMGSRSSSDESLLHYVEELESSFNQTNNDKDSDDDMMDSQDMAAPFKKRKINRSRIDSDDEDMDIPTEVVRRGESSETEFSNSLNRIACSEDNNSSSNEELCDTQLATSGTSPNKSAEETLRLKDLDKNKLKDVRVNLTRIDSRTIENDDSDTSESSTRDKWNGNQEDDEEEDDQDSTYSDDSFIDHSDSSDEVDSDEETRLDEWKEPDPAYLHINDFRANGKRGKRSAKECSGNEPLPDVQEVSIHKIKTNHPKFSGKCVEDIIKKIVNLYNNPPGKKGQKHLFIDREVKQRYLPIVRKEDLKYFQGESFKVKVFVQKVSKAISLLKSYGVKEKATTIHVLIFHYRHNELFAVTTNHSWNVVQWCSDFEFPGKIAARLLSTEGELESTNKGLVGTELLRKTTHKQEKKTNPYEILSFWTKFMTELRENASILKLSCFQNNASIPGPSYSDLDESIEDDPQNSGTKTKNPTRGVGVKVTVSLGNIRIHKRISTVDMLSILSVLSRISNGQETTDLQGKNEKDSTTYKRFLTSVQIEVAKELNVRLASIIHDAIANDEKLELMDNYTFCHKHATDFFKGYNFTVLYKDRVVKDFKQQVPTVKEIVLELRPYLGDIRQGTSEDDFLKQLDKVKISYLVEGRNKRESKKRPEKFMNFIDGVLYHSGDNSVFWHVSSMWCHVQDGYLYIVHNQFRRILNELLLLNTRSEPAFLPLSWPRDSQRHANPDSKIKEYLAAYARSPVSGDYWISNTPGEDFIDMLKIVRDSRTGKNILVGYYFVPGPNYKICSQCSHIKECLTQIGIASNVLKMGKTRGRGKDVAGSEHAIEKLKKLYSKVSEKINFETLCPNFKTFLEMFKDASFILAIGRENSCSSRDTNIPSLEEEKSMSVSIRSDDIADIFNRVIDLNDREDMLTLKTVAKILGVKFSKDKCMLLAKSIHKLLEEQEFVESTENSITAKLLSQDKSSFELTENSEVNEFLYEKIVYKFQPRACTVLSKLEFIHMRKEISTFSVKSFNMLEIPFRSTSK